MTKYRTGEFLGLIIVLLVTVGCAGTGINQGDFNVVSIEEEWELGQQLSEDLARELDLVDDPVVLRYVNNVGNRIVDQTQMANLPWNFHVVRDEEINAFNIPGGHVYIHTGLISTADNASEFVGVMSHEIGHGVARHATEQLTRAYGLSVIAALLLGSNPAVYEQILAQILGTGAIASFSREAEREADELAVRYLYDGGYDPRGLVTFFEELLSRKQRRNDPVSHFFATHPLTEERIQYTQALVAQLPPKPNLVTDEAAYREMRGRLN